MLAKYLSSSIGRPFDWATDNCALWVASGILLCTGYDPAADLRGRYLRKFDWLQLIKAHGGLANLIRPRMVDDRLRPLDGDGAVIARLDGAQMCGFRVSGRLVVRTEGGLKITDDPEIVEGWSW